MEGWDRATEGDREGKTFLSTVNCTSPLYCNYTQERKKKGLLIG